MTRSCDVYGRHSGGLADWGYARDLQEDLDDILNDNDGDIVDHGLLKR